MGNESFRQYLRTAEGKKLFAKRVTTARERLGLSQQAVAEMAGVKRPQISLMESKGSFGGLATLTAVAEALGVSLDWLCGRDAPSPETTSANEDRELAEPDPARHNGPTGPGEAGKGGSGAMSTTGASVDPWVLLDRLTRAHENYSEAAKIHAEAHMEEARTHRLREENIAKQTAVAPPAEEIPHFPSRATRTAAERAE